MNSRVPIATIPINARESVRIGIVEFRGIPHLGIRLYDAQSFPTKAGLDLPIEHLPALAAAVTTALEKARGLRLLAEPAPAKKRRRA